MSGSSSCPNCGRKAEKSMSSWGFQVHTCRKCGAKYCQECGGKKCPECSSTDYIDHDHDKVYAK